MDYNSTVLVIDGQYLFRRNVPMSGYDFNSQYHIRSFVDNLAQSFVNILADHSYVDYVIFATDKNSWRKHIDIKYTKDIHTLLESKNELGYKAQRKPLDDEINWDNAKKAYNTFLDAIRVLNGVTVATYDGAEGDDIAFVASRISSRNGDLCVLWGADQDSDHLVNNNTIVFKPNRNEYTVNEYLHNHLNTINESNSNVPTKYAMFNMKKSSSMLSRQVGGCKYEFVNPMYLQLIRGINGMRKENVYSCINWITSGGRIMTPNKKNIEQALDNLCVLTTEINNKDHLYNPVFLTKLVLELYKTTGYFKKEGKKNISDEQKHELYKDSLETIQANIQTINLNSKSIPEGVMLGIYETIKNYKESALDRKLCSNYRNIVSIDTLENESDFDFSNKTDVSNIIDNFFN